ncbi:gamma-crystallin D-like [Acropora palmata]|uniref:gamma-crystallin D-like n=1 Tax=Acropora palmata TaxID=6131 RepID=UPI003DA04339
MRKPKYHFHFLRSSAVSVKLYFETSGGLYQEFDDKEKNLHQDDNDFKRAVVTSGTWIFYTNPNYNNSEYGGQPRNIKVLKPGQDENISGVNGSMYLLKDATEGIVLFEHSFYGGTRMWYEESCANVYDIFPANSPGGVSSAIVLSKNQQFAIFTKPNYQGIQGQLKAGQWYETPTAMGFPNDKVQSVRKV